MYINRLLLLFAGVALIFFSGYPGLDVQLRNRLVPPLPVVASGCHRGVLEPAFQVPG